MKVYLNNRFVLVYPGKFDQMQELEAFLQAQRIEMRVVEPEALDLSVAALAGFVRTPPPTKEFAGTPPAQSCIVFVNLPEEKLSRVLDKLTSSGLALDYKAVLTGENRDWAFGALMQEMQAEEQVGEERK